MGNLLQDLLNLNKKKETIKSEEWEVKEYVPILVNENISSSIINKPRKKTKLANTDFLTRYSYLRSKPITDTGAGVIPILPNGDDCNNVVTVVDSAILSGQENTIGTGAEFSTIVSGFYNSLSNGVANTILFGYGNTMTGSASYSLIQGGAYNSITSGTYSIIGGGAYNTISGQRNVVAGGNNNKITGSDSVIAGGSINCVESVGSGILSGSNNKVITLNQTGSRTNVISGGATNCIMTSSGWSSIAGGGCNKVLGSCYSTIIGGFNNQIPESLGNNIFIAGTNITADRANTLFANNLSLKSLPTSDAGLPVGSVWNNQGVLNIVI